MKDEEQLIEAEYQDYIDRLERKKKRLKKLKRFKIVDYDGDIKEIVFYRK